MATINNQKPTSQEKVYNLYLELVRAEKDKKEAVKMHGENIKRIKEEIKELIDEAEEEATEAQMADDPDEGK